MKKYLILGLLVFVPFIAKADLMGFLDGNMYDPSTATWKCQFLGDGNCYDLNENVLFTRPAPADTSVIVSGNNTFSFPTNPLEPVPQPALVVPAPVVSSPQPVPQPTLLPAYTEQQLLDKIGVVRHQVDGSLYKVLPMSMYAWVGNTSAKISINSPITPSIVDNSANGPIAAKMIADFNEMLTHCQIVFQGQSYTGAADIDSLTPYTHYPYQFIYSEDGRQTTTIQKDLYTVYN